MGDASSSGGLAPRLLRGVTRIVGACGLALLSIIWCLGGVLPAVHYRDVHYRISSGTKGWNILSGQDAEGRVITVRYLWSSGAVPELPGQRGMAQEILTSRLPMLERVMGSDLLALTRHESVDGRGTRERHWELSPLVWWMRVLAHLLGGVCCGVVALSLSTPYIRWTGAGLSRLKRRLRDLWHQRQGSGVSSSNTEEESLPDHPLLRTPVRWQETADPYFPYAAQVEQEWWEVRLNDFPTEPMYSLMVEGNTVVDFNNWPACWDRPDTA